MMRFHFTGWIPPPIIPNDVKSSELAVSNLNWIGDLQQRFMKNLLHTNNGLVCGLIHQALHNEMRDTFPSALTCFVLAIGSVFWIHPSKINTCEPVMCGCGCAKFEKYILLVEMNDRLRKVQHVRRNIELIIHHNCACFKNNFFRAQRYKLYHDDYKRF